MSDRFFNQPILNSPYEYPARHWELDDEGQPTQQIIEHRRGAKFITPIPKPRQQKQQPQRQFAMVFDEGKGLSTGEQPDIDLLEAENGQVKVRINGVDVFHPSTGEVRSDGAEGIAVWFVDTDYNEESFFVRQAYFLGADDPYKALKTTLKAEINQEAWDSLHSDTSRPFAKPTSGRIAVKVINHLGDEVMKVFKVR